MPVLILLMLASLALSQAVTRFSETIGVDFYQFWGVPVAMRLTGHTLGAPYVNGQRYFAVLKEYAGSSSQPKLRLANRFWSAPDFAGSPLLYRAFALVSNDFSLSLGVFQTIQILSFLGACVLLGYLYRFDPFYLLSFALLCLLFYQPLLSDLRVANLGCLQLASLAGLLGLASALPRVSSFAWRAGLAALLLVALAALTLCKPNIVLISALVAIHLAVRHGARLFAVAALVAVIATALLLAAPCVYFGSWAVWQEWYHFVYGGNPAMLVRSVASGNYSTALLLSSWLGVRVPVVAGGLLVLLAISLALVAGAGQRTPRDVMRLASRRLFDDPRVALAVGILATAAASPLFWAHYYVLMLLPSLWLLNLSGASKHVATLAAVSVVMSAGMAGMLLWWLGWRDGMATTIALSWVPLWCALLLAVRSFDLSVAPAGTSGGETRSGAVTSPRSRRRRK